MPKGLGRCRFRTLPALGATNVLVGPDGSIYTRPHGGRSRPTQVASAHARVAHPTMVKRSRPRIMLIAPRGEPCLLGSYGRALEKLEADVRYWDWQPAMQRAARFGSFGRRLSVLVPVAQWEARANRDFVVAVRAERPDAIFVAGATRIAPGALAQVKASIPEVRLVLVWPNPLLNLWPSIITTLPLYESRSHVQPAKY